LKGQGREQQVVRSLQTIDKARSEELWLERGEYLLQSFSSQHCSCCMSSELVEILNLHLSFLSDKGKICSNQFELERARKRATSSKISSDDRQSKVRRTSMAGHVCFLCDKENPTSELRQAMTMQLDKRFNNNLQF
jgi:hypothetical protein